MSQERLNYTLLDVFCLPERPYTGNQLAIVHGSQGLSQAQLQSIAKEFNLSETTFPSPPPDGVEFDYSVRIFTIARELQFAGHPSIGTAWSMRDLGIIAATQASAIQSCGYGKVKITFSSANAQAVEISSPPSFVKAVALPTAGITHPALTLPDDAHVLSLHRASCGLEFVYLRVADDASVVNAKPVLANLRTLISVANGTEGKARGLVLFYVESGQDERPAKIHQRMFPLSFAEDPATGSASLGLGLVLLDTGILPPLGLSTYDIRQGAEMGRPSAIQAKVLAHDGIAQECWVSGEVVKVGEGWIRVPPIQTT
ncbi:hypothetical protein PLICRDRAFT_40144 [Plicaturopsis crispa FD-325 SS-3]|nr:hypothetical protein PLICRDRAFT_40144 [Plicaturopsis crispa FD-325 SS-3]